MLLYMTTSEFTAYEVPWWALLSAFVTSAAIVLLIVWMVTRKKKTKP